MIHKCTNDDLMDGYNVAHLQNKTIQKYRQNNVRHGGAFYLNYGNSLIQGRFEKENKIDNISARYWVAFTVVSLEEVLHQSSNLSWKVCLP